METAFLLSISFQHMLTLPKGNVLLLETVCCFRPA